MASGCDQFGLKQDMRETLANANTECPVIVDEYTMLQKVVVDPAVDSVDFWYVISREGANKFRHVNRERMREAGIALAKKNPTAKAASDNGWTVRHIYEDAFQTPLFAFTVNNDTLENRDPMGVERTNPFMATPVSNSGN
ncbi:hypothetical protein RMSM_01997 [Rhodopirellula maiorica SM1]|uniref:Uncharacterized protein n=2 Tax=Novipirellula TaxID=2795426 RepID=M5RP57_9BACT|nr:hypothetical protein RMSM_01997 [Rhodopirellula maiorica SM1]